MRKRLLETNCGRGFTQLLATALLLLVGFPLTAKADFLQAKRYFELQTREQQISETLGLIATGDFQGLADFGFTHYYYRAVTSFQLRSGFPPNGILSNEQLSKLKIDAGSFYAGLQAQVVLHKTFGSSILVPKALFNQHLDTATGEAYERDDQSLSLSLDGFPSGMKSFEELYAHLSSDNNRRHVLYKKLTAAFFVVSGTFEGRNYYTWMSRVPSGTTGFTLSWNPVWEDKGKKLSILLANSFQPTAPANFGTNNGEQTPTTPNTQSPPPIQQSNAPTVYSGTGFQVSDEGHILTNNHVIESCNKIVVKRDAGEPIKANVVAADPTNDLAVLKAEDITTANPLAFRAGPSPKAGEDIVVFGYPKIDLLSQSGNLVTGNITALAGVGDDSSKYQISAPIQHGNSGGPVSDRNGHVVAVVVARLETAGDQNINFAIKSSIAENFLNSHGIKYQESTEQKALSTPDVGDILRDGSYLILCSK